jgi:hypothetical protein
MPSVVSRLVLSFIVATFATASHAAPKKKGRNPAEAAGNIAPAPSDLTTLDSEPTSGDNGATQAPPPSAAPNTGGDDPALYNLNQEIPLYKKQTSHEQQRLSSDDPFLGNATKSAFKVGFSITNFSYQELGVPTLNEEKGLLPILHLRYESAPFEGRWRFGFRSEISFLRTSYTGVTINNALVNGQNHSSFIAQGELYLMAKLADLGEGMRLHAYAGMGYRHWSRMAAGDGIDTFDLNYQWVYLPVGLKFEYMSLNDWGFGVDVSLRRSFLGRVFYGFAEVDPTLANSEGILGSSAMNFRIAAPISFKRLIGFPITIEPYFEKFGFGAGAPAPIVSALNGAFTGFIQQPESSTSQIGVAVTADFQF